MAMRCVCTVKINRNPVLSKSNSGAESKFLTEFQDLEFIGKFRSGIAMKCRNVIDDHIYAVKIISLKSAKRPFEEVLNEVKAMGRLLHPNFVRYHQAWLEENFSGEESLTCEGSAKEIDFGNPCLYIQMEFCPKSLKKFSETSQNLDGEKAWKLFCQIMDSLAKAHVAGVAHLDLSPDSILLDAEDNVRISGFGSAELYNNLKREVYTKTDMRRLSVIFAELYHHLHSENERLNLLKNLREKKKFPESLKYEEHEQLIKEVFTMLPVKIQQDSLELDLQEVQIVGDIEGKDPDAK